jgi:hypothetical protein
MDEPPELLRQRNLMQQIQNTCVQHIESDGSEHKTMTICVIGMRKSSETETGQKALLTVTKDIWPIT